MKRFPRMIVVVLAGWFSAAAPGGAAQGFRGRVLDGKGRPLGGTVVSAQNRTLGRTTSVYADNDGNYQLPDLVDGAYDLRARHFGFKDRVKVAMPADGRTMDLTLAAETDDDDRMAALPSNRWFALALTAMPNDHMREEFERQCTFCHQQGSWATRVGRTPEQWEKIFTLMARMGGILSSETRRALPSVLNAAYDHDTSIAKLKEQLERYPLPSGGGLPVVIDEWEVGDRASVQHDIVVHPEGYV